MWSRISRVLLNTSHAVLFFACFSVAFGAKAQEKADEEEVPEAVKALQKTMSTEEIRSLTERIRNGLPPDLLDQALDSLKTSGNNLASKTLMELANHRSPAVREKVASSLSFFKGPGILNTLKKMLDDQDAKVRSQAAFSIGKTGAKAAMKELMEAAKLGVTEAADIVGNQASPAHVSRLTKMIDKDNLLVLAPVMQAVVGRKNIPKSYKLAIINRLGKIDTLSSKAQIRVLVKNLPETDPVKKAATKILEKEEE